MGAKWGESGMSSLFAIKNIQIYINVPGPETYAMLVAGLASIGVAGRRKRRQVAA